MKKSLLLSIVMTLVLVVAMSTATFAWYTADKTVSATDLTITAATSGSELLIANVTDGTPGTYGTSVSLGSATLDPMIATKSVTSNADFKTYTSNGTSLSSGSSATAYIKQISIYNNGSTDTKTTVTLTATLPASADTNQQANLKYVVLNNTTLIATNGYNLDNAGSAADTDVDAVNNTFKLEGTTPVTLTIIVWLEGINMTNADQGEAATVSFSFAGESVAA